MLKISYFHTLMALCSNDAIRQSNAAASVHRRHELGRPAAAFLAICVINDADDKWRKRLCVGIRVKV